MAGSLVKRLLFLSVFLIVFSNCKTQQNGVEPYKTSHGWGYKVNYLGKTVIIQENIPAINKNTSFKTKKEATRTGGLVLSKLIKNSSELPDISIRELDSLKIFY